MIGAKFLRMLKRPQPGLVRETFWGLLILWIVGWLPYIGWMVKALAIVIGLGAVLVSRFGTHRGWACVPTEPPPLEPLPAPPAPPPPPSAEPPSPAGPDEATPGTTTAEPPAEPASPAPPAAGTVAASEEKPAAPPAA
jgi:hypothetical protein